VKVNYVPFKKKTLGPQGEDYEGNPVPAPTVDAEGNPIDSYSQSRAPVKTAGSFQSLDPITQRQALSESLLQEGMDSSPTVGGVGEGFARLGKALLGGIMKRKADEAYKKTKGENSKYIQDAFDNGDYGSLITSDDPVAQRLGSAVIEQQFKQQGNRGAYRDLPGGIKVWEPEDGSRPSVISRPVNNLPRNYQWVEGKEGEEMEPIPGSAADPKVIQRNSTAGRAPPKPKTIKQVAKLPWE
jgi:hypothetical protein